MRQYTTCKEAVTSVIVRLCRLREDKQINKNDPKKKICVTLFNTQNQAAMEEKKWQCGNIIYFLVSCCQIGFCFIHFSYHWKGMNVITVGSS